MNAINVSLHGPTLMRVFMFVLASVAVVVSYMLKQRRKFGSDKEKGADF